MKYLGALLLALLLPSVSQAWEIIEEREDDGRVFIVAEQAGEAGAFFRLVCFEEKTHIEIVYPAAVEPLDDYAELLQVDERPERLVAGFIDIIDDSTSIFIGIDRRDEPAASTPELLKEIAAGQYLYLGDPDLTQAIERWSLAGSRKAIEQIQSQCS